MINSQQFCSVSTLLCYLRVVPLWIIAILALALLPLKGRISRALRGGSKGQPLNH